MNRPDYTRRDFLKTVGLGTASLALPGCTSLLRPSPGKGAAERPNIILIMTDDMGYSDVGCYGGEIRTPNIDRLAAGGQRFTQFYNNAVCVPTRASLLTGLYSRQVGVVRNSPTKLENCVTIAEALKTAGYRTLMTGKWHAAEIPTQRGFDRYYGLADGCVNSFNPGTQRPGEGKPGQKYENEARRWAIDDQVYQPYTPDDRNFYMTDAFTDYAVDYLEQYGGEDQPFFLYVAYTAPHYPLHARPEDIARYRGRYMLGWDELRQRRFRRMVELGLFDESMAMQPRDPDLPAWEDIADKEAWDLKMAVYAAMIDRVDQGIGRILAKVRQMGKEENTLVFFLSDNGGCAEEINRTPDIPPGPLESYRTVDPPWANASNTPFRKYKRWDHEGGICTPLITYWPKVIRNGGGITRQRGHIIDVMATCCDIAGAEYPRNYRGRAVTPLEGKSLLPVFEGKQRQGHKVLCWEHAGCKAVRQGKWKLVAPRMGEWELYDMETDRTELHDLAARYSGRVREMAALHDAWVQRCGVQSN